VRRQPADRPQRCYSGSRNPNTCRRRLGRRANWPLSLPAEELHGGAEAEPSALLERGVWFSLAAVSSSRRRFPVADTVRSVEYYYVTVADAPGGAQRILSALKDRGVNLHAFLGFPLGGGQSQIDLVPDDPESLRAAAERAGVTLSAAKRAFLIQGDDRVGAVADTTAKLAEANINVAAAAATGAGSGRYGMIVWVAPADFERAADALGA
jgi:hypothetical protein